jgi:hypothetical protein
MQIKSTTLWLPKDGNSQEEYEDAAYPNVATEEIDCHLFRCAVADGATETSFARLWADLLVRGYADEEALDVTRNKWQKEIPVEDLPWYVEEKASAGAYAALVGLTLLDDGSWHCQATGDSCLIHCRDESMIQSFPLDSADQFNNRPSLICSKASAVTDVDQLELSGNWQTGDRFILLTDAIARWLLSGAEPELKRLWSLEDETDLRLFVGQQRAFTGTDGRPKLHNDDLTIMRLEIK